MTLVILCLDSILISLGLNASLAFKIAKEAADRGYKFNYKKLKDVNLQFENIDMSLDNKIYLFFPFVNIIKSYEAYIKYNDFSDFILNQFIFLGALEKMNKLELEEYYKKPTGFHAMATPIIVQNRISHAYKLIISSSNKTCEILFDVDRNENIDIIKRNGNISFISDEKIYSIINLLLLSGSLKNYNVINLSDEMMEKFEKENDSLTEDIDNEIQNYKDLREEIINMESHEDSDYEKAPVLSKKRNKYKK